MLGQVEPALEQTSLTQHPPAEHAPVLQQGSPGPPQAAHTPPVPPPPRHTAPDAQPPPAQHASPGAPQLPPPPPLSVPEPPPHATDATSTLTTNDQPYRIQLTHHLLSFECEYPLHERSRHRAALNESCLPRARWGYLPGGAPTDLGAFEVSPPRLD